MRLILRDTIEIDQAQPEMTPGHAEAVVRPTRLAIDALDLVSASDGQERVLGAHAVGIVEQARDDSLISQRVMVRPIVSCGECDLCLRGLYEHCRDRQLLGITRDGCHQSTLCVPLANLVPIPEGLGDDDAIFAPMVARAIHAATRLRVEARPYVTVLGDDAQALICAQHMTRLNASVRVIGEQPRRFQLCEKWQVKHRHADEIGRRADQDVVIISRGVAGALDLALRLIRPRGKVVLLPGAIAGEFDARPIIRIEAELVGVETGPIDEALDLLARGGFDTASLVERRMSLAHGPEAYRLAAQPDALHVLMDAA